MSIVEKASFLVKSAKNFCSPVQAVETAWPGLGFWHLFEKRRGIQHQFSREAAVIHVLKRKYGPQRQSAAASRLIVDNFDGAAYLGCKSRYKKPIIVDIMLKTLAENGVEGETLAEHALRQIQSAIVKGEIAPGSKISEPELARAYGISRGPLREALHRLEGQKLLVRVPHVGARVVSLSRTELGELYQVREALEGLACRLAAERMGAAQVAELRDVLKEHERDEAFQAGRGYYLQEGDFDFHYRIVKASANGMLIRLLCDELYQLARMYRIQHSGTPNRPGQAFAEHHRILDAIAEGDGELAEMLMRRHIRVSRMNIERQIV